MNHFIHRMLGHFLQAEAGTEGADGGGQQQAAGTEGQQQQTQQTNLLDQGAGNDFIPEKYRVQGADGALDITASSRKMAEAYTSLEKRVGTGDLPPKAAEDYAPKIEADGFNWDEFKADPESQAFLKGAHAKGMTNAQVEFVLGQYLGHVPGLISGAQQLDQQQSAEALRGEWKTDAEFKQNLGASYRAAQAFGGEGEGLGSFAKLQAKFGNDPDFIAFTARIGKEMAEDVAPGGEAPLGEGDFAVKTSELRNQLQAMDMHDPKRKQVQAQLDALYQQRHGPKKAPFQTR